MITEEDLRKVAGDLLSAQESVMDLHDDLAGSERGQALAIQRHLARIETNIVNLQRRAES